MLNPKPDLNSLALRQIVDVLVTCCCCVLMSGNPEEAHGGGTEGYYERFPPSEVFAE